MRCWIRIGDVFEGKRCFASVGRSLKKIKIETIRPAIGVLVMTLSVGRPYKSLTFLTYSKVNRPKVGEINRICETRVIFE